MDHEDMLALKNQGKYSLFLLYRKGVLLVRTCTSHFISKNLYLNPIQQTARRAETG